MGNAGLQGLLDPTLSPTLEGGDLVTFVAPMVKPVFTQRDTLLDGEVIPDIPGVVGFCNDANDNGKFAGAMWEFYGPNDIVTLRSITRHYEGFTLDVQTKLQSKVNQYYYAVSISDNPEVADLIDTVGAQMAGYFGDVAVGEGHRHSGTKFKEEYGFLEGADTCRCGRAGTLDNNVEGDGLGVGITMRKFYDGSDPGVVSVFFHDLVFGGTLTTDTDAIVLDTSITFD